MADIKFEFLTLLSLNQNEIESVESLSTMMMPNLVKLSFGTFGLMKSKTKLLESATSEKPTGHSLKA